MNKKQSMNKLTHRFIIGTFVTLYIVVSLISTIHVIEFFKLSNPDWLAISLAIAFEIGAAASLAALIALKKMSKLMVWGVFIILAAMQMMGNTYYAFSHLHDFAGWSELFGLNEEELIYQKRILSIISGAILPLIALGFIKSLVDYIRPAELKDEPIELTPADAKVFVETITNPPAPNEALVKAAKKYKEEAVSYPEDDFLVEKPEATIDAVAEINYKKLFEEPVIVKEEIAIVEEPIEPEPAKTTPEMEAVLDYLVKSNELSQEDIENYKEKTKGGETPSNPQVIPGVN
jgi:hypothetical protein